MHSALLSKDSALLSYEKNQRIRRNPPRFAKNIFMLLLYIDVDFRNALGLKLSTFSPKYMDKIHVMLAKGSELL